MAFSFVMFRRYPARAVCLDDDVMGNDKRTRGRSVPVAISIWVRASVAFSFSASFREVRGWQSMDRPRVEMSCSLCSVGTCSVFLLR